MSARRPKGEPTKQPGAAAHPKHKMHAFWPPWLGGPLVLSLGALGHWLWGQTLPAAAIVPLVLVLSTTGLAVLTYHYAGPRTAFQRWHAVLSVVLLGLSVVLIEVFGTGLSVKDRTGLSNLSVAVLFACAVLALSWNIRRFDVVRGTGEDKHGEDSAEKDWHGLRKPRSLKVTESDGKRTQAKVKLSAGQTAKDVEAALRSMGSDLGTITNGIRVEEGAKEGEVELTMLWEDQLTDAVGWDGPDNVGGSIADPISLGLNEQQQRVLLRMAGDYNEGIAPGHTAIVGEPRTGKGIAALIIWANLRAKRDVFPVINDAAKGEQMLMFLRPGMPREKAWINKSESGAKVQASAIARAIKARNEALGDAGFSSWTPEAFSEGFEWRGQHIHMPALVFHIEEFAPIGTASPRLFTKIAEQGLSAGVFLLLSLQRASHDRFPTSMRSVIGNGICYGAHSDIDVSFALPDSAVAGGATPANWGTRFPGRAMASLNGQPEGMERIPFKTHYASTKAEFEDYMKEMMAYLLPMAPDLDPCTREAFGQPYEDYLTDDGETAPAATPAKARATVTSTDEDDDELDPDEEDDEDMDDEDDELYEKRPLPEGLDVTGIDPARPLPEWEGAEIDLTPPPSPGKQVRDLLPEEKRVLFREILQRLADEGVREVRTGQLVAIWTEELGNPQARQGPTVGRFLADAAAEDEDPDRPNDLLGCLDRGPRGVYYIRLRPRQAALNGHV